MENNTNGRQKSSFLSKCDKITSYYTFLRNLIGVETVYQYLYDMFHDRSRLI